ncbi:MAG TPA: Hsp20 family protein [Armatimonadota bacterium]|nr:Hsp20 family protein [Armatimonadota bacterium]
MSALRRWEPFRSLMNMQGDRDRVFEEFFGRPLSRREGVRAPTVDMSETVDEVVVRAEMSEAKEGKEETDHRRERIWRGYERAISLPAEVVTNQVKAVMKDGGLEMRLPKTARSKAATPRKVAVE